MIDVKLDDGEMLGNEVQLNESQVDEILEGEAETHAESNNQERDSEWVYVYSGQAMTQAELFHFSACEDISLVLVAGSFGSGKTTLETMLYYVFLEGKNKKLSFCGSRTIPGFWKRSRRLMCYSGEPEPVVPRTSIADKDWFLHLKVKDDERRSRNLVFADFSGEVFDDADKLVGYTELFHHMENIILIMDGERICDNEQRNGVYTRTIVLLKQLLKNEIMSENTKLQIVCTKYDRIEQAENRDKLEEFLQSKWEFLQKQYRGRVYSMDFMSVSALRIDDPDESEKLETLMYKCMEDIPNEKKESSFEQFSEGMRQFERFVMRG